MKKFTSLVLIIFCLSSCSGKKVGVLTDDFLIGKPLGELTDSRLKEASGLAASIKNPGYLWSHNDSGNDAEIFLIDKNATIKLKCVLKDAKNRDWEDIAVGPGPDPDKSYVYVGDIGDNNSLHRFKTIYRFEEPVFTPELKQIEIAHVDRITFKLSDRAKDMESLTIDPLTKDLYVISKREKPVHVYQLKYPYGDGDTLTGIDIASIPVSRVVAGALSPNGKEFIIKNYGEIYYWKLSEHETLAKALTKEPRRLPYDAEPQGEAIAWARDGSGFYTLSEQIPTTQSHLFFFKRK